MLSAAAAAAAAARRAFRHVNGSVTLSRKVSDRCRNLAVTAGVGAVTVVVVVASSCSATGTRSPSDGTTCYHEGIYYVAAFLDDKMRRLRHSQASMFLSSKILSTPHLSRCDSTGQHFSESNDQEPDDDCGYTEEERFWQCLDYHRSLLHDYDRRWGHLVGSSNDGSVETMRSRAINDSCTNHSAQWPRNIPTVNEVSALEYDLCFCERCPNFRGNGRICQDKKFRIAAYSATQGEESIQRQGFRIAKELAEKGHPDGMCYYGKKMLNCTRRRSPIKRVFLT